MPNILNEEDRQTILARIRKLEPKRPALWGKMNAGEMVCHLGDQMRVALGEIPGKPVGNILHRTLVKWLIIYVGVKAPPGKIETVPEMLTTKPSTWEADVAALEGLIERLSKAEKVAPHPAFGRMSLDQWGILAASHIDHHLRQFGV